MLFIFIAYRKIDGGGVQCKGQVQVGRSGSNRGSKMTHTLRDRGLVWHYLIMLMAGCLVHSYFNNFLLMNLDSRLNTEE